MRRQSGAATALSMPNSEIQSGAALRSSQRGCRAEDPGRLPPRSKNRLSRYGPLVIWAALIFIASSSLMSASHTGAVIGPLLHWLFPHASDLTLATAHFFIRKAAHFTEYAILGLLAARAFRSSSRELLRARWFWVSFLFVVAYSLSDEFHQSFVPSRTPSIYDSMIDSAGGLAALVWLRIRVRSPRVSQGESRN